MAPEFDRVKRTLIQRFLELRGNGLRATYSWREMSFTYEAFSAFSGWITYTHRGATARTRLNLVSTKWVAPPEPGTQSNKLSDLFNGYS